MPEEDLPPFDHSFEGDRARYMRDVAQSHRQLLSEIVEQHREVKRHG